MADGSQARVGRDYALLANAPIRPIAIGLVEVEPSSVSHPCENSY